VAIALFVGGWNARQMLRQLSPKYRRVSLYHFDWNAPALASRLESCPLRGTIIPMSTKKQLLIIALCCVAFALTGCTSIQATFKDLLKSGIRFLGYVLVISALISGAVLLIQGKVNMIVGSSRGVSEVVVALAAIFAGLILGLLGPVFVDAVYSGLEARSLISNEIPVPFK
jgi:hypothetical protein